MFPESLRLRIQIWHGFLLAAVLAGFAIAAYRYQSDNEMRRVDGELRQRVRMLMRSLPRTEPRPRPGQESSQDFRPPPPGINPGLEDFRIPATDAPLYAGFYYVIWRRDGSELTRSSNTPADVALPPRPDPKELSPGDHRTRGLMREVFNFTPPGECFLVGRSIEPELADLRTYARWLTALSGAVLVAGLAVGWWLTSRALRPIGAITSTAGRIARGDLRERIPVREKSSELGRLANTLNETFAQLEESFERQARFTADAAHELRTPVSIILSQAQHVLTRERDTATYQRFAEVCVNAARRLQKLTESLLELAAHDADAAALKMEACDLAEITRETAALLQTTADERNIALGFDLAPAPCHADAGRIERVIQNLLANALDHTPAGGRITLVTRCESGQAIFSITDTGPGIAPEHQPRIFDRFYRTDDSRNRRTGGAGLGLAICKTIVEAHGGTLEVTSQPGAGTTFTLRLSCEPKPDRR